MIEFDYFYEILLIGIMFAVIISLEIVSKRVGRDILLDIVTCKNALEIILNCLDDHKITDEEQEKIKVQLKAIIEIASNYIDIMRSSGCVTLIIKRILNKI